MQHGLGLVAEAAAAAATAARQAWTANRSSGNAVRARGDSLEAQIVQLELQLVNWRRELGSCRLEQSQLESRDAALEERVEQSAWAQVLADGEAWWEKAMPAIICLQAAQRRRSALRLREEREQQELRAAAPAAAAAPGPAAAPGAARPPRRGGRKRKPAIKLRESAGQDEGQDGTKRSRPAHQSEPAASAPIAIVEIPADQQPDRVLFDHMRSGKALDSIEEIRETARKEVASRPAARRSQGNREEFLRLREARQKLHDPKDDPEGDGKRWMSNVGRIRTEQGQSYTAAPGAGSRSASIDWKGKRTQVHNVVGKLYGLVWDACQIG
jgi:hypothetical protein